MGRLLLYHKGKQAEEDKELSLLTSGEVIRKASFSLDAFARTIMDLQRAAEALRFVLPEPLLTSQDVKKDVNSAD